MSKQMLRPMTKVVVCKCSEASACACPIHGNLRRRDYEPQETMFNYQKCGGGRRVLRKKIGRY